MVLRAVGSSGFCVQRWERHWGWNVGQRTRTEPPDGSHGSSSRRMCEGGERRASGAVGEGGGEGTAPPGLVHQGPSRCTEGRAQAAPAGLPAHSRPERSALGRLAPLMARATGRAGASAVPCCLPCCPPWEGRRREGDQARSLPPGNAQQPGHRQAPARPPRHRRGELGPGGRADKGGRGPGRPSRDGICAGRA